SQVRKNPRGCREAPLLGLRDRSEVLARKDDLGVPCSKLSKLTCKITVGACFDQIPGRPHKHALNWAPTCDRLTCGKRLLIARQLVKLVHHVGHAEWAAKGVCWH